jgi:alpha-glucosidase
VVAFDRRGSGGDHRLVAVNFATDPRPFDPGPGRWVVEIASDGTGEGQPYTGPLAPDQAVVLAPS